MAENRRPREAITQVLAPAIEAVRTALRRREADDVPHRLRRVVQSSARRLPPPLVATLLEHLEGDEKLRLEAADLISEPAVAVAYLRREDGWWEALAEAVMAHVERQHTADAAATERALGEARAEVEETKRRLTAVRDELDGAGADLDRLRTEHTERLADIRARDLERISSLEQELERLGDEVSELRAERDRLRDDLELLRRRSGRSRGVAPVTTGSAVDLGRDPVQVARTLDLQLATWRRRTGHSDASVAAAAGPDQVRLDPPPGLRATDAAWFTWLATTETPFWLIVDGHNVVFSVSEDRELMSDSRRRLEAALRRLAHAARTRARITLVYDSGLGGDRDPAHSDRGVVIAFAPSGVTADDEIVALAQAADGRDEAVLVVTSDRGLTARLPPDVTVVASRALADHIGS